MSMQRAAVILYVKYDDVSDVVFLKKEQKALHDYDHSAAHKVDADAYLSALSSES